MPHYDRAPIAEAIIDLRVDWPADAPDDVLDGLAERLKSQFPKSEPINSIVMGFAVPPGEDVSFSHTAMLVGRRLDSSDGKRVLQVQRAGFTYSHLPQYTDWVRFSSEAEELWQAFIDTAKIETVTRAAVRVVNKIVLPGAPQDLSRYTKLMPNVPAGLPAIDGPYFVQMQGEGKVEGSRVIINSGRVQTPEAGLEFLLDFDLFVEQRFDARSPRIWSLLKSLSEEKNNLFEACITDDFRKLIQ